MTNVPMPGADRLRRLELALPLLWVALCCTRKAGKWAWQLPLDPDSLKNAGLLTTDLRWLIDQGYIEHARVIRRPGANDKKGRAKMEVAPPESITARSRFILTTLGEVFCQQVVVIPLPERGGFRVIPCWDAGLRELRLGYHVVKRYRQPAGSQQTVLAAFQEEGWRSWIFDPLPGKLGCCPKARLRETVANLNRAQMAPRIHFSTFGDGEKLGWRLERTNPHHATNAEQADLEASGAVESEEPACPLQ